ncbi:DedA family protein [bacterium]|nr:DedA family protein [bacterium]
MLSALAFNYLAHGQFIKLITLIGYPGLALILFLESGVIVGVFLPGASLLFTAGILASQDIFNIWLLMPILTCAAILGDSTGYWTGAKLGPKLFTKPQSLFFKPSHVAKAHAFYEEYGPETIILARFIPVVRTFAPMIAGVAQMPYGLFLRYNIIGAVLFSCGVTGAGYLIGEHVPWIGEHLTLVLILIVVASCAPLVIHLRNHHDHDHKPQA